MIFTDIAIIIAKKRRTNITDITFARMIVAPSTPKAKNTIASSAVFLIEIYQNWSVNAPFFLPI